MTAQELREMIDVIVNETLQTIDPYVTEYLDSSEPDEDIRSLKAELFDRYSKKL